MLRSVNLAANTQPVEPVSDGTPPAPVYVYLVVSVSYSRGADLGPADDGVVRIGLSDHLAEIDAGLVNRDVCRSAPPDTMSLTV